MKYLHKSSPRIKAELSDNLSSTRKGIFQSSQKKEAEAAQPTLRAFLWCCCSSRRTFALGKVGGKLLKLPGREGKPGRLPGVKDEIVPKTQLREAPWDAALRLAERRKGSASRQLILRKTERLDQQPQRDFKTRRKQPPVPVKRVNHAGLFRWLLLFLPLFHHRRYSSSPRASRRSSFPPLPR